MEKEWIVLDCKLRVLFGRAMWRWRRRQAVERLLTGKEPLACLRRPARSLVMLAILTIGIWGGYDLGRRMQWHRDWQLITDGPNFEQGY